MTKTFQRRPFLRSSTGVLALPALNLFSEGQKKAPPVKRMVFLNFGWGVTEKEWYPSLNETGENYKLTKCLEPLKRHKKDFSIIQGLWHKYCIFNDAGHSGSTFWLTGANRFAQPGVSFSNTISVDQVAAEQLGQHTRFNSLQLNGSKNISGDGHGPGLSLAWDSKGKPVGGLGSPLEAYKLLFSDSDTPIEQVRQKLAEKRSVLDTMLDNARQLKYKLGKVDNEKLDEYFEGIRKLENRIAKENRWLEIPRPKATMEEPKNVNAGKEFIEIMYDIIIAAFQTDSTRIATFRQPVQSLLNSLSINAAQHDISHYHGKAELTEASIQRDQAQSRLFAGFLDRLKKTKEADGSSLFDHTCVVYGSNLRTGHSLDNCPTIVSGGASGIKLGQHIVESADTPLNNLWLTLLRNIGVPAESHGDSTGVLEDIIA